MKRTEAQIIEAIKSEIRGIVSEYGWDENIISAALNKRYNPEKIAQAIEELHA